VKNEESPCYIPTIVNGITSITTNQETAQETSVMPDDGKSAMNYSVITNLRESIKAHQNKEHSSKKHRIILIGDSNMRGYVGSLEPFLNSSYSLYSVVKPGSSTNELVKTANEVIRQLTHDDMIILCYGTNDFDQKIRTFQNIKNFIMNNNHTNILLMNIPFRYDRPNTSYVNKIISSLNRKLQKLVKINPHTKFLETCNDRNLFTKHGLHRNKQGKNLVKLQLASFLYTIFVPRSSNSIPLKWYEACIENNDIEDIKISKTSHRISCHIRKVPVTRTNHFLCST
jgi:lysophospholipase L1-like esterase